MPKHLIGSAGGQYLKESKSVMFHPTPCEALESLSKVMSTGFAGCVHFTPSYEVKVLILLYTTEKKAFLGFIPNNQTAFVDKLRKVIVQNKQQQTAMQQQQAQNMQGGGGGGQMGGMGGQLPNMQQNIAQQNMAQQNQLKQNLEQQSGNPIMNQQPPQQVTFLFALL